MTIVASGELSLGVNTTVTRSIACELGLSGTAQICMDQAAVRSLAGRPSGAICFCDFYNKFPIPALGGALQGGYYMGSVSSPANYLLVIAPNATGCACCSWKTDNSISPNTDSTNDGYANTRNGMASSTHPAGNFCATRSLSGFSDWYLSSNNELGTISGNQGSAPAGEGFVTSGGKGNLSWQSTQCQPSPLFDNYGTIRNMANNKIYRGAKSGGYSVYRVRAVRRIAF